MMIWPLSLLIDRPATVQRIQRADHQIARTAQGRAHIEALAKDIEGLIGAANGDPLLLEKKEDRHE